MPNRRPRRESAATFEPLEGRRLLSATVDGLAAQALGKDGERSPSLAEAVAATPADVRRTAARLGGDAGPVPTAVAAAWTRAADLSSYPAGVRADLWVAILPDGAAPAGADVTPTGLIPRASFVAFAHPTSADALRAAGVAEGDFYPVVSLQRATRYAPDDSLYPQQWHLNNAGQGGGAIGADANLEAAWDLDAGDGRVDGTGVTIGVVDDGVYGTHPDLSPNFDAASSYDFVGRDSDPAGGGHGTNVAGVAAARGDNGAGVTGAAFDARVAGLRLLGANSDANEAGALSYAPQTIDVYNNSWGPFDDGRRFEAPGPLTAAAIEQSATDGRDGRGAVIVWAGGNGGGSDDSNRDGYANSRHTIAVGAVNNYGAQSTYSEDGANLLVAAPSSGGSLGVTTTSFTSGYTSNFGGTSSASPLAAGVVALMLEANPELTYRDVEHILVRTSTKGTPGTGDWTLNGAGLAVSAGLGFGRVDAAAAVSAAMTWTPVADEVAIALPVQAVNAAIPDDDAAGITRTFDLPAGVTLEHLALTVNLAHSYRGDLEVFVTSPAGTVSKLLNVNGDSNNDLANWTFTTARHWGEEGGGTWSLRVADRFSGDAGTWQNFSVEAFGTAADAVAPAVAAAGFAFEVGQSVEILFDEPVGDSLTGEDLVVTRVGTGEVIDAGTFDFAPSPDGRGGTWTRDLAAFGRLPAGDYVATLPAGSVSDAAGNATAADASVAFFALDGDFTRDRAVNLADFTVLANNFGRAGTFSAGDANYDGTVNLADFTILANAFGATLPPPPAPAGLFGDAGSGDDGDESLV